MYAIVNTQGLGKLNQIQVIEEQLKRINLRHKDVNKLIEMPLDQSNDLGELKRLLFVKNNGNQENKKIEILAELKNRNLIFLIFAENDNTGQLEIKKIHNRIAVKQATIFEDKILVILGDKKIIEINKKSGEKKTIFYKEKARNITTGMNPGGKVCTYWIEENKLYSQETSGNDKDTNDGKMIIEDSRLEFCQKIEISENFIFFSFYDSRNLYSIDQSLTLTTGGLKKVDLDISKDLMGSIVTDFKVHNSTISVIFDGIIFCIFSLENNFFKKLKSIDLPSGLYYSISMFSSSSYDNGMGQEKIIIELQTIGSTTLSIFLDFEKNGKKMNLSFLENLNNEHSIDPNLYIKSTKKSFQVVKTDQREL